MAVIVQKAIGEAKLPEPQKVADAIIQGGKDLSKHINDIVAEVSSKPDINSALSVLAKRINSTVEDLQKQVPAMQTRASELQKNLQNGMNSLVAESQRLAQDLSPVQVDLKKSLESVMDQVSKAAIAVENKVKEVIGPVTGA